MVLTVLIPEEPNQLLPMEIGNDLSTSLSFASSSSLSNGSSNDNSPPSTASEVGISLEVLSLSKLSSSLEKLVVNADYYDYGDADIEIEGISVGVHRCILAARSQFFHELFKNDKDKEGKPKYSISQLMPQGRTGYDAFMAVLNYLYTGKVKAAPPEVSTCVDESCAHDACGPAIQYAVEMMYASNTFQIEELVLVIQRRLLNFVVKAFVEDVIPILVVAFHCESKELLLHCVQRIATSDLDNIILEKELPYEVLNDVKSVRRTNTKQEEEEHDSSVQVDPLTEKMIRIIHRALDSNDIELVKLLLKESNITLDAARALHYASAYCIPKMVSEVLNMGIANVNLRNSRGYTVLHVAARRKDLSILVGLLNQGASVSDTTVDRQTAVTICRGLTRPKDFNEVTKQGQETNNDRLCIDVLEREMRRNPLPGNMSVSSMMAADDLHMMLLLLENRVAMARSLFPREARIAMHIAHADLTLEFAGLSASKGSYRNFRDVDLNEIPSEQVKRLQERLQSLQKTVDTGRRFFPNRSEVLDNMLEDDTLGALLLEKGTPEERRMKKTRYMELQKDLLEAFNKDMAANHLLRGFSSSSSSPKGNNGTRKVRQRKV